MPTPQEWKKRFKRRIASHDQHLLVAKDLGGTIGTAQTLVCIIAEMLPAVALERVEEQVRDIRLMPGSRTPSAGGPRPEPTWLDTERWAFTETVERAKTWHEQVAAGRPAGESARVIPPERTGDLLRASYLMAAGLLAVSPPAMAQGLALALRPSVWQSPKAKDLSCQLQMVASLLETMAESFGGLER